MSKGLILADQTGVGKGRTVASIIRWSVLSGKRVIFITQKDTLFVDMVRDLRGIDFSKEKIFTITSTLVKVDGKNISSNGISSKYKNEKIIFTTYSQIQGVKPSWKKDLLLEISENAIIILDEAHEAAASVDLPSNSRFQGKNSKPSESNRYLFMQKLFKGASGVLFSSATYAKRPDNLMLYYKFTDLNYFDYNDMLTMLKKTGSNGQSLISNALVESGQLLRRESSFSGINFFDYTTSDIDPNYEESYSKIKKNWNMISNVLKKFILWEKVHKKNILRRKMNEIKSSGGDGRVSDEDTVKTDSSSFSSLMHNMIKQFDLSLKAESIVRYAKKILSQNEKVLIYLHYTNSAFFKENFSFGEVVDDSVKLILMKNCKNLLNYNVRISNPSNGQVIKNKILLTDMGIEEKESYLEIENNIEAMQINVPLSALDFFHEELRKDGHKTLEITGRDFVVNYRNGKTLEKRTKDKTANISNLFNNTTDHNVLIFNSSGSTGISLHSSSTFKDQRKRHMIVAQTSDDINIFMQAFGRINRTGQTVLPDYSFISLPIPVSNRMRIVLRKKLNSLNANVKGSTKDESLKNVVDMSNEIGDSVVSEFLGQELNSDNPYIPKLNDLLGDPLKFQTKGALVTDTNSFMKVTGRLPILSTEEQEVFYEVVTNNYLSKVEDLDRQGISIGLQEHEIDLQARTISSNVILQKKGETIFQSECILEKVEVKTQAIDVSDIYDKIDIDASEKIIDEAEKNLTKYKSNKLAENPTFKMPENFTKQEDEVRELLGKFLIGKFYKRKTESEKYYILTDIKYSPRDKTFPFSKSYFRLIFLSSPSFDLPFYHYTLSQEDLDTFVEAKDIQKNFVLNWVQEKINDLKNIRQIITGNLIYGLQKTEGKGRLVKYTTYDGKIKTGILIHPKEELKIKIYDHTEIARALKLNDETLKFQLITLKYEDKKLLVSVPRSNKSGGIFFLNKELISLSDGKSGFVSRNENSPFVGVFDYAKLSDVLDILEKLGVIFESVNYTESK